MKRILTLAFFFLVFQDIIAQPLPWLKISDDHRYLVTEDNKPFLWLGGTAWELIHRLTREEVDFYLKDRAEKGFSVIQTVILAELDGLNTPNAYGYKPLIDNDPTQINEDYFQHVDYVVKKAEQLGLYVGLLPTWGDKFNLKWGTGPIIFDPQNAEKYGEIIAHRYKDQSNIIWILGGDRMPETDQQAATVRAMAQGIRKVSSKHLISYHPAGARSATDAFNEKWLDIDMFQSGHDRRAKEYDYVTKCRAVVPARPVIEGEPRYENIPDRFWEPGEHDWLDDSDVRVTAYWTLISGAAGYTYGCHDIWQMYAPGRSPGSQARTGWQAAMNLPGSQQMMYVRALMETLPWQTMANDQSLVVSENPEDHTHIVSSITADKKIIIVYTPWGKEFTVDLSTMKAQNVEAYWYNPRSGDSHKTGQYSTTGSVTFKPWAIGRGSDFILILKASNSEMVIPGL